MASNERAPGESYSAGAADCSCPGSDPHPGLDTPIRDYVGTDSYWLKCANEALRDDTAELVARIELLDGEIGSLGLWIDQLKESNAELVALLKDVYEYALGFPIVEGASIYDRIEKMLAKHEPKGNERVDG